MSAKPRAGVELDLGLDALAAMLSPAGQRLRSGDHELLLSYASELEGDDELQRRMAVLVDSAHQGFFHLAAQGHAFVAIDRFEAEFDGSLEHNYPGSGAAFMKLAVSYWTLRMLEGRVSLRHAGIVLQQVLYALERRVGATFFPESDPEEHHPDDLAGLQRDAIEQSGAPIDVDGFLLGNPLLMGNPLAD